MKKNSLVFLGIFMISFVPFLWFYLRPSHSNVFEEIYHDEYFNRAHWLGIRRAALERIPDISVKQPRGTLYGIVGEDYEPSTLPAQVEHIGYIFHYPEDKKEGGKVSINILFVSDEHSVIGISYTYYHSSNKLEKSIYVIGEQRLTDRTTIYEYIIKNNIDLSSYYKKADDLLRNKLIPDWLSVYPSRFSKDNWGNVKIVKDNVLD